MTAVTTDAPWEAGSEWQRPTDRLIRRIEVACTTAVIAGVAGGFVALANGWAGALVAGAIVVAGLGAEYFVRGRVRA